METFSYTPSFETQAMMTPRTLVAQFGDGYVQEAGDGINAMLRPWDLVFSNRSAATGVTPTLKQINDFLTAHAGYVRFLWTQPPPFDIEGAKTFVCKEWSWVYSGGLICGIRAKFLQRAL